MPGGQVPGLCVWGAWVWGAWVWGAWVCGGTAPEPPPEPPPPEPEPPPEPPPPEPLPQPPPQKGGRRRLHSPRVTRPNPWQAATHLLANTARPSAHTGCFLVGHALAQSRGRVLPSHAPGFTWPGPSDPRAHTASHRVLYVVSPAASRTHTGLYVSCSHPHADGAPGSSENDRDPDRPVRPDDAVAILCWPHKKIIIFGSACRSCAGTWCATGRLSRCCCCTGTAAGDRELAACDWATAAARGTAPACGAASEAEG